MNESSRLPTKRIQELDGLRAFAVCAVVLFHMHNYARSIPQGPVWVAQFLECIGRGAVNIFFIISGYIITNLLFREKNATCQVSLTAFYIRRFFRIVPPLLVFLATLVMLRSLGKIMI